MKSLLKLTVAFAAISSTAVGADQHPAQIAPLIMMQSPSPASLSDGQEIHLAAAVLDFWNAPIATEFGTPEGFELTDFPRYVPAKFATRKNGISIEWAISMVYDVGASSPENPPSEPNRPTKAYWLNSKGEAGYTSFVQGSGFWDVHLWSFDRSHRLGVRFNESGSWSTPYGLDLSQEVVAGAEIVARKDANGYWFIPRAGTQGGLVDSMKLTWTHNGKVVQGPEVNSPMFTIGSYSSAYKGEWRLVAANSRGRAECVWYLGVPTPDSDASSKLANISTRAMVRTGDRVAIGGFVVDAPTTKHKFLIRGVGPTLESMVAGSLTKSKLVLHKQVRVLVDGEWQYQWEEIATNSAWESNTNVEEIKTVSAHLGAFPLSAGSFDAALLVELDSGLYTAALSHPDGGEGVGLIEVYSATTDLPGGPVNLSTRHWAASGSSTGIAGFVIQGNAPKRLLIRGVGPALADLGVSGAMPEPMLILKAQSGATIFDSEDWGDWPHVNEVGTPLGAFGFEPGSRDSAMVVTLMPGQYTCFFTPRDEGTPGVGLVELYNADDPADFEVISLSTDAVVPNDLGWDAHPVMEIPIRNHPRRVLIRVRGAGLYPEWSDFLARGSFELFKRVRPGPFEPFNNYDTAPRQYETVSSNNGRRGEGAWEKTAQKAEIEAASAALGLAPLFVGDSNGDGNYDGSAPRVNDVSPEEYAMITTLDVGSYVLGIYTEVPTATGYESGLPGGRVRVEVVELP